MRRRRGFTLIETVVVAGLLGMALFGTLSLLGNFTSLVSGQVARSETARQTAELDRQMARDLAAARPCGQHRIGDLATSAGADTVLLTIDPDGDGQIRHVRWQVDDAAITRTVVVDDGTCSPEFDPPADDSDDPLFVTRSVLLPVDQPEPDGDTEPDAGPAALSLDGRAIRLDVHVPTRDGVDLHLERIWVLPERRTR